MSILRYYKNVTEGITLKEQLRRLPKFIRIMIVQVVVRIVYSLLNAITTLDCTDTSKFEERISNSQQFLILCTGNICRSPFAEHYMRNSLKKDIKIESAGLETDDGRSCPSQAQTISKKYDVDLSAHTSQVVTENQVKQADIILLMDWYNYYRFKQNFRGYREKVFLLGSISDSTSPQISDPHGHGKESFCKQFQKCKKSIDEMIKII